MTGLPPELVSAVLAAPAEALPRLACADWLDEHGDPDAATVVRAQVRLARHEQNPLPQGVPKRLRATVAERVDANFARWVLAPLGTDDRRGVSAEFRDGFVVSLTLNTACRLPPEQVIDRLGAFPLLEEFRLRPRRPVPQALVERLPELPLLGTLALHLTPAELGAVAVARLAALPALTRLAVGRGAKPDWLVQPDEWGPLRGARLARLRVTPAGELIDAIQPYVEAVGVSHCGHVSLTLGQYRHSDGPLAHADGILCRLPGLTAVSVTTETVPGWLAEVPGLLGLGLEGLTHFDPRPLAGLTDLRSVTVSLNAGVDGSPALEWLQTLPRLEYLALGRGWQRFGPVTGGPFRLPELRFLSVAGERPALDAPKLRAGPNDPRPDVREAFAGVSLRRPGHLVPLPVPPSDGSGVEALASWAEWGDGDPRHRVAGMGPAWLTLERLPFPVRAADAGAVLTGPPGSLADVRWRGTRPRPDAPRWEVEGGCPFAGHFRALWTGRRRSLRLRAECPSTEFGRSWEVPQAIAATLTGDIDA